VIPTDTGGSARDPRGTPALPACIAWIGRSFDLLERDVELDAVEALIGGGSGWGGLLEIEGPPGIGKTSLIIETQVRAQDAGMRVFGARCSELETTFSFGVVRQLFEPFLAELADTERARLLAGAAASATACFRAFGPCR
jgi:hypothetical protein